MLPLFRLISQKQIDLLSVEPLSEFLCSIITLHLVNPFQGPSSTCSGCRWCTRWTRTGAAWTRWPGMRRARSSSRARTTGGSSSQTHSPGQFTCALPSCRIMHKRLMFQLLECTFLDLKHHLLFCHEISAFSKKHCLNPTLTVNNADRS